MFDARPPNDSIGACGKGQIVDGRDHPNGNANSLDFLGDRCTATIAGASCRYQQAAIDLALLKILRDALS